jgi:VWFA-related protein
LARRNGVTLRNSPTTGATADQGRGRKPKLRRFAIKLGALALLLALPVAVPASQDAPPADLTIRSTTRVVLVDAIVTDGSSQPVNGLTAADFTVLEDGKPQQIAFFANEVSPQTKLSQSPPRLRPGVYTNRPEYHARPGPLNILLLDGLNTPPGQQIYARKQILKYLASSKLSGSGTAVFALGNDLSVLQDFTTDSELLMTAVRNYVGGRTAVDVESPKIDIPVTMGPGGAPAAAGVSVAVPNSGDIAGSIASQTSVTNSFALLAESLKRFDKNISVDNQDTRVRTTLAALRTISRVVAGYPGRKSLLWFSAGFPFQLALDESMDLEFVKSYGDQIRDTTTQMAESNVAVYPIDTAGLWSATALSDPSSPTRLANFTLDAAPTTSLAPGAFSRFDNEATMNQVADQTGGKVFRNTNDLAGALEAAVKDSSSYYVLGYYPERKKWDGKYHSIKVALNNKQYKVRSRSGYFAVDPANWRKGGDSKQLVSTTPINTLAATGILFYAQALKPEKKGQPFLIEILVDANTITYGSGPEGTFTTDLEFQIGAFSPEGKLEKVESQTAEANLSRETHAQLLKNGIPVKMEINLKPGRYNVRTAVRDNRNGHLGTLDIPVVVN